MPRLAETKPSSTFNDFIAAAEYLIDPRYTTARRLAINGGSNGGLLVGAVMTQLPDPLAAVVPQVGVLDRRPDPGLLCMTDPAMPLLEVIACTVEDAVAAENGGADRIELVRDLGRGGLTPEIDLAAAVVDAVRIPVRVMIREEEPFVVSGPAVAQALCDAAAAISALSVDGLVLGFLDPLADVDEALLRRVLGQARGVHVTFHRAFEAVRDPVHALASLSRWPQIDRVLVNGGGGVTAERLARLRRLAALTGSGIRVLSAVGSDRDLLAAVCAAADLREAHVGRAARDPETVDAPVSVGKVRELVAARDAVRRTGRD